jgi:predicted porin
VGRDYIPTFWNLTQFDPFGTVGVGSVNNIVLGTLNPAGASIAPPGTAKPQVRTSNSIGWLSADINGFRVQIQQAFSEVPSNCLGIDTVPTGNSTSNSCVSADGDGKHTAFRLTYNNGPLFVGAANSTTKYATSVNPTAFTNATSMAINAGGNPPFLGDYKVTNFGGSYDFGVAKLWAQTGNQINGAYVTPYAGPHGAGSTGGAVPSTPTLTSVAEGKLKYNMLGVTAPVGAWTLKATMSNGTRVADATVTNDRKQKQTAIGAVYAMSKRTSLYGTYSTLTATGLGASASQALTSSAVSATSGDVKATGVDLGISHRF